MLLNSIHFLFLPRKNVLLKSAFGSFIFVFELCGKYQLWFFITLFVERKKTHMQVILFSCLWISTYNIPLRLWHFRWKRLLHVNLVSFVLSSSVDIASVGHTAFCNFINELSSPWEMLLMVINFCFVNELSKIRRGECFWKKSMFIELLFEKINLFSRLAFHLKMLSPLTR